MSLPVRWCLGAMGVMVVVAASRGQSAPPQARSAVAERSPIILLGASYAQGWRLPDVAGSPVVNRGIGGQQSFELLERFDRDVIAARPRAVIIWGHINDVYRAPPDSMEGVVARARDSYVEMVRKARSAGIEVIVASEITIRPPKGWSTAVKSWMSWLLRKERYDTWVNRHVTSLNDWLRDFAAREGLLLLDLQAALADSRGRRRAETSRPDGSHVSPAGYDGLTGYAVPLLERYFSRSSAR